MTDSDLDTLRKAKFLIEQIENQERNSDLIQRTVPRRAIAIQSFQPGSHVNSPKQHDIARSDTNPTHAYESLGVNSHNRKILVEPLDDKNEDKVPQTAQPIKLMRETTSKPKTQIDIPTRSAKHRIGNDSNALEEMSERVYSSFLSDMIGKKYDCEEE
jgi:hypothetical protein